MPSLAVPRTSRPLILVSGLSGAGKASILRILEDIGYEAVDNPPQQMVQDLVQSALADEQRRLAVGIDVRSHGFDAEGVVSMVAGLRSVPGVDPELIYVWASDESLHRRFSQTRRRHPLAEDRGVVHGLAAERDITRPLRLAADVVIDTTDLSLADLRRMLVVRYFPRDDGGRPEILVTLVSFAFPAGLPRDADMVFDVRFLSNPHYVKPLAPLTGHDEDVSAFIKADACFSGYFERLSALVMFTLPRFVADGKKYVTIAIGCSGGRHRSVFVAEQLRSVLLQDDWRVRTLHRELVGMASPSVSPVVAS